MTGAEAGQAADKRAGVGGAGEREGGRAGGRGRELK